MPLNKEAKSRFQKSIRGWTFKDRSKFLSHPEKSVFSYISTEFRYDSSILDIGIIIIIMSCRQYRYPWPSLATSPYRSSPLAGLQDYIPYPHRAAVCMFEMVVLVLLCHMWGYCDHHVVPPVRISLTLSRHFSLSFIASGRSSGLHPVSSQSCRMYVRAGRPSFARPYVGVLWSSCHAASTAIPDPLLPLLPIVHRLWQVFRTTSRILTELLYVCSSWSSCFCSAIYGGP